MMMKFPNMKVRFKFKNRDLGKSLIKSLLKTLNLEGFANLGMLN